MRMEIRRLSLVVPVQSMPDVPLVYNEYSDSNRAPNFLALIA
jgi:hypothetical protein